MPIKPENRARYPKDWKQIRERILSRAHHRCEHEGCKAAHRELGYWRGDEWVRLPRVLREAGYDRPGQIVACSDGTELKIIMIVLTTAHVGLPAHLPVNFHVAASAQANEVVEVVGFAMPLQAEQPEWAHMMHRRALAEFGAGASATPAGFFVAFPGGDPGVTPCGPVMHVPLAVDPQTIRLTSWRLVAEPLEAARIAAKAAAGAQVEPAGLERLTAAFATTLAEPAFRQAQCFAATGVRTGLSAVRSLLRRQVKRLVTDDAFAHYIAQALGAADARTLDATSDRRGVFESALIRAGLSRAPGIVSEQAAADSALQLGGAGSWASHRGMLLHCDEYPENCDDDNLRAWCQKHHLRYDAEHHKQTAYATRRARSNTLDLFAATPQQ